MANIVRERTTLVSGRTKTAENDSYNAIDPSGDIMLEVGDPATSVRIRASSKALSLASPVFAAMFSPRFAEGKAVSSEEFRPIALPDDDPDAITTLCNVVHLLSSRVSVVRFASLEKLSLLCDKYDCAEALAPWSTRWLSTWQGSLDGEDRYLKMVYIAYAYGHHDVFWDASSSVLKCYDAAMMANVNSGDRGFAILPGQFLDDLQRYRKKLLREVHKGIEAAIEPYLQESNGKIGHHDRDQVGNSFSSSWSDSRELFGENQRSTRRRPNGRHDNYNPTGCKSTTKIGIFILQLSRLELWPLSDKVMALSVQAVLQKASQFQGIGELEGCGCRTCAVSFKDLMAALATDQLRNIKGLCLCCVRSGRLMPDSGNCQNKEFCAIDNAQEVMCRGDRLVF